MSTEESIKSLENVSKRTLFEAFQEAFKDYEIQLTESELHKMLQRRGFTPELSFGAFLGDKLLSFTFNGRGSFTGLPTAYDTGTGTIEKYRGNGLAAKIFEYSIPHLKAAGISQYLLEVLQHNSKAVSIYKKLGFKVSREFNYFTRSTLQATQSPAISVPGLSIRSTGLQQKENMRSFWDHQPSWQNSFEAVERVPGDFVILGAYQKEILVGYCIFEPESGDITQIAVHKNQRRKGIGRQLLRSALESSAHNSAKAINYEIDLEGFSSFIESFGIKWRGRQYEMLKQL